MKFVTEYGDKVLIEECLKFNARKSDYTIKLVKYKKNTNKRNYIYIYTGLYIP